MLDALNNATGIIHFHSVDPEMAMAEDNTLYFSRRSLSANVKVPFVCQLTTFGDQAVGRRQTSHAHSHSHSHSNASEREFDIS
jgi:hypothetical protein